MFVDTCTSVPTSITEASLWVQISLREHIMVQKSSEGFTVFFSCDYLNTCVHVICVHPCLSSHVLSRQLMFIASTAVMSF